MYRIVSFCLSNHPHTHTLAHCLKLENVRHIFTITMRNDVIFSHTVWWWILPTTGWARVSSVLYSCVQCQNISPPQHAVFGCMRILSIAVRLHAFWFKYFQPFMMCTSHLVCAFSLSPSFQSHDIHISRMFVCRILVFQWKTSRWFDKKNWQFNRDS